MGLPFASNAVKKWLKASGVRTLFVAPGSPWENGYVESFNSKLRDELLNRELFLHIDELRYIVDRYQLLNTSKQGNVATGFYNLTLSSSNMAVSCGSDIWLLPNL